MPRSLPATVRARRQRKLTEIVTGVVPVLPPGHAAVECDALPAGPIFITETRHGFICANAGIDQSSSGGHGRALLLPVDPDASCARIRASLKERGLDVAVIMSDTFGRPWREAQTDIAIGIAGMQPVTSYIGQVDPHGHEFRVQALCTADEIAGAAELVKGNLSRVPAAVVRGLAWEPDETGTMQSIIRDSERDVFR